MNLLLYWLDFLKDPKYSFKFKIANIIMDDLLRTNLESSCVVKLNSYKLINANTEEEKIMQKWAEDVLEYIVEIFEK